MKAEANSKYLFKIFGALKLLQYSIKLRFFFTENFVLISYSLIAIKIPKICLNYKAENDCLLV